ncbi:MAG: substrate-binding domain-containing protein [Anaerolineales bacterium]|jgi:putative molybdopterin biosynthesis protein
MLKKVNDYPALKLLGDSRRLAILQLLMEKPATLSHLGEALGVTPARVRHHLVQLEEAGYVALVETRPVRGFTEKYYQASAQVYWINLTLLPTPTPYGRVVVFGSHDPALESLAGWMKANPSTADMSVYPVGSLNGLVALQQGLCQFTGCHLFDPIDGDYNTSYVRHFFPGQPMHILTLAHRQQGLVVAPGNPSSIKGLEDLQREEITFINRNRGSGTRLWLDQQLIALGIEAYDIKGYEIEVNTHAQIADAVQQGRADVGLAVMAAAQKAGLNFIPLFEERYDLVIPEEEFNSEMLIPALDYLQTGEFRKTLETLGGYNSHDTGNEIHL